MHTKYSVKGLCLSVSVPGHLLRKSFLGDSEDMRRLGSTLLPGINLYHLRDIKRVYSGEGICCDQHNTTVSIDFFL